MREQNILAANEFIELFCEFIVQRLTIITKQRYIKARIKELYYLLDYFYTPLIALLTAFLRRNMVKIASEVAVSQWLGSDYLVSWKCQTGQLRKPSQVKSGQPGSVHSLR
ncbi:putative vacuolar protein sorting-associated protein Ist1 [Helianthus anomalus]